VSTVGKGGGGAYTQGLIADLKVSNSDLRSMHSEASAKVEKIGLLVGV
jgi:hypothetical protein